MPDRKSPPSNTYPIDCLRTLARNTGTLQSVSPPEYYTGPNDAVRCVVQVTRKIDDRVIVFYGSAHLDEVFTDTDDWWDAPRKTLAECAEADGYRRAYPLELGDRRTPNEPDYLLDWPVEAWEFVNRP